MTISNATLPDIILELPGQYPAAITSDSFGSTSVFRQNVHQSLGMHMSYRPTRTCLS